MRTYVGEPHHCYCVTVLFYDLVVPSVLIRHINKDCYYRHVFLCGKSLWKVKYCYCRSFGQYFRVMMKINMLSPWESFCS